MELVEYGIKKSHQRILSMPAEKYTAIYKDLKKKIEK